MLSFIRRSLKRLLPVPGRWLAQPRMPDSLAEAEQVFRHWDTLNGRHSFLADVLLDGGRFLCDVVFDGDSGVAVRHGRLPVYRQIDLVGRTIKACLITEDRSPGKPFGNAPDDERRRFREEHGGQSRTVPAVNGA